MAFGEPAEERFLAAGGKLISRFIGCEITQHRAAGLWIFDLLNDALANFARDFRKCEPFLRQALIA